MILDIVVRPEDYNLIQISKRLLLILKKNTGQKQVLRYIDW